MLLNRPLVVSLIVSTGCFCFGQTGGETEVQNPVTKGTLQIAKTVPSNDVARSFATPLQCDADGNVYSRSDSDGFPSIHKINPKGERTASFVATSCSDIKMQHTGQFFIAQDGRVYEVAFPLEDKPHVLIFKDDGTCHSKIKLDTPFSFSPYQLVVFPSGNMLIAGTRWRAQLKQYVPYTALFSSSGTVLKDVDLDSDPEKPQGAAPKAGGKRSGTTSFGERRCDAAGGRQQRLPDPKRGGADGVRHIRGRSRDETIPSRSRRAGHGSGGYADHRK